MSLLELTGVDTYYGQSHILHDVSLTVDEGSLCALVGRNGAGKTTTLRSIMGVQNPRSGTVRFDGVDITDNDPHQTSQAGVSLIPEHRRVFPELSVEENLRLGHLGQDVAGDRVASLTDQVFEYFPRLEERKSQQAGQMSGGEQQMLAIARGMLSDPDMLLIDEPTEGLMPALVEKLRDILTRINRDGITVLLVEQNVELAFDISDYAYIIDEGENRVDGPSEELKQDDEIKDRYLALG
ncbi:ABC transporter ATP-binding protein [Halorientalis sp.]|jgi:branched-chain amino acid transport system ATP-binding protein|uniref:ABC transporter ATP-binding protein n=1 Tax=Halorientalis sp. TaxID=1931229 RepID=UPI0026314BED|nr:ABC transporter ATP-binding protein [Halorientalis sp.]